MAVDVRCATYHGAMPVGMIRPVGAADRVSVIVSNVGERRITLEDSSDGDVMLRIGRLLIIFEDPDPDIFAALPAALTDRFADHWTESEVERQRAARRAARRAAANQGERQEGTS